MMRKYLFVCMDDAWTTHAHIPSYDYAYSLGLWCDRHKADISKPLREGPRGPLDQTCGAKPQRKRHQPPGIAVTFKGF